MVSETTLVIPTVGRPSLHALLHALAAQHRTVDAPVIVVDDRPGGEPLELDVPPLDVLVLRSGGGGPARARNLGWRHARTAWVSFLDDDVLPGPEWYDALLADLAAAADAVGTSARVRVPLPQHRRPTDWERNTKGLETARWITADLSYRRDALARVGGFDERFPRAFREDADLALRVQDATGAPIVEGTREITHPVRPSDDRVSLRQQAGNADDALMRARHGRDWHRRADAPVGRIRRHAAIAACAGLALAGAATRRRWPTVLGAAGWLAGSAELAAARIRPGPRDRDEVRRMLLTSAAIPLAATYHHVRGRLRHHGAGPWRGLPDLVLFDRDGTLVRDVPYNNDPAVVRPVAGATEALDRLRREGVRVGVITNQSGVARGLITREQLERVNARVEELLGPFDGWYVCHHGPDDGCACRKPAPGLVKQACAEHGVEPDRCVIVGDIGSDVGAAEAAGAHAVLVPTPETRPEEVEAAPRVAPSLSAAVEQICAGQW